MNILSLEEKHFGFNHCDAGKYIFQRWNFPDEYIDAVSQHHSAFIDSPYEKIVKIVGTANIYARLVNNEIAADDEHELLDNYKKSLGLTEEMENFILNEYIEEVKTSELFTMSQEML